MFNFDYALFIPLALNFSILASFSIFYAFIINNISCTHFTKKINLGILFGIISILSLSTSFHPEGDAIFSSYAVIISTSGFYGGILCCIITISSSLVYIFATVDSKLTIILCTVFVSGIIGIIYNLLCKKKTIHENQTLVFILVIIVQIASFIFLNALPCNYSQIVRANGTLIMALLYPIGQFFLLLILSNLEKANIKEKELINSNERLVRAGKLAKLGHWEHDIKANTIYWDNEIYKIFEIVDRDYKPTFKSYKSFIHPDDRDKVKDIYRKSINEKKEYFSLHSIITQTGKTKYLEERGVPIFDKKNNLIKTIGTVIDVTEKYLFRKKINKTVFQTFDVISAAMELRDPYTKYHQKRVANLASQVAIKLGWTDKDRLVGLYLSALVHDIGKLSLSYELLNKGWPLTAGEVAEIRKHPKNGHDVISKAEFPWPIKDIILQHHERLDGTGYPSGLKEDKILEEAKIIAVCDVYEAMVNDRPYRKALGKKVALEELYNNRHIKYDSKVVDTLTELLENNYPLFDNVPDIIKDIFAQCSS